MKTTRIQLTGPELNKLVPALEEAMEPPYICTHGPVVVMLTETYYLRTDSNLLTTVIIALDSADSGTIEIVSGGGKTGMLGIDWGAEQARNLKLVELLEQLCAANGWTIAQEGWSG